MLSSSRGEFLILAALVAGFLLVARQPAARPSPRIIRFENVAAQSGLSFVLQNHPTPEKNSVEAMPGGIAVFDYNNDGRPDIFFTNGAKVPSLQKQLPNDRNRLYRNDGNLKFTDVTEAAGLTGVGFSNGAAAADYDNDGNVDLFVAGAYRNLLYRNRGNGTFEDVTEKAGITSGEWSIAAGWIDFDNDGLLDLFVVNYLDWNPKSKPLFCGDPNRNLRIYCHPKDFGRLANRLYRNRGDGTFEDVSERTGIARYPGRGMSVAFADYDGDGFPDIFVTNDQMQNFLFHNVGGKRFEEVALMAGIALLDTGREVSNMGIDVRDYDNDGRPDVAIADLAGETFPLFHNEGKELFRDVTHRSGMAQASVHHSGWCAALVDLNNDGYKDLFTTNSHVNDLIEQTEPSRYKEPNMVFENLQDGRFADVSASAGQEFATLARAHRGCAFADFDGDGRTDVVVTALGEPAELWHNVTASHAPYLDVFLHGTHSNRDGIGATIRVGSQWQIQSPSQGYASSSHTPVHFGGLKTNDREIEVQWPGGKRQRVPIGGMNRVQIIEEPN